MDRRLYKSQRNRVFFGVCGGLGEYFNVDPVIVRLIAVVFAFTGAGLIAYIAAAIIIPENPDQIEYKPNATSQENDQTNSGSTQPAGNGILIIGIICICAGAIALAKYFLPWADTSIFAAVGLIILGLYFVAKKK